MKIKFVAMLLLLAMLLCNIVGCAGSSDGDAANTTKNTDATDVTPAQNTAAVTEEESEKPASGLLGASSSITAATASSGMYLSVVGNIQGKINGECKAGGNKSGTVELADFSDGVTVPIDGESGLLSGRRRYEPVTFVHKIDCASPKLRRALTNGEQLDLTVDFYRIKSDGTEEKYYSIIYEDAIIVSMEIFTKERNTHFEEISFTFRNVTYVFQDGNISFSDAWK